MNPGWKEGWWYLATLLYDRDRYAEARDAFRRFVQLDPKSGSAYALLGLCQFETHEYEQSLLNLQRGGALAFDGKEKIREVASYHLGLLLTHFEQYEAALESILDEANRQTSSPLLIEAAGIAALRKPMFPHEVPHEDRELVVAVGRAVWDSVGGRRPAADAQFRALLERYPSTPNLHYLYGSFLLKPRFEEGMAELKKELDLSPNHVPALVQLASQCLILGEYTVGLPYAQKAAELAPRSFAARTVFGRLLVAVGKIGEGIAELETARELAPGSPETRAALAAGYRAAGRLSDAAREAAELERLKRISRGQTALRPLQPPKP